MPSVIAPLVLGMALLLSQASCQPRGATRHSPTHPTPPDTAMERPIPHTEAEWRSTLNPDEYRVLRQAGTEAPYSHPFWNSADAGTYSCRACGRALFLSDSKFTSHCGWPSFFQPLDSTRIEYRDDRSHGMHRIEVRCARCHSHLGHVFDDGPPPTGQRYCINGLALEFAPLPPAPPR